MNKFQALLFDLDGLLIDSEKVYHRVSYEMAAELQVDLTEEILDQQMGRSPLESMEIFREQLQITSHSAKELVDWRDRKMLEAFHERVDLMPGALDILHRASEQFPVAIATGSTRNLVEVVVDTLGIRDLFYGIVPSDEINQGKPNPEIYLVAAELLGVAPEACVVLEDSSNGSKAGHRAGCYTIAIPNEYTRHQDFSFVDQVCLNLTDAWNHIISLSGQQSPE